MGEPRRSGRATKGQHTKNLDLDIPTPKRGRKSKGANKQSASEEPDDDDNSIIRCICGATEDEDGWTMIFCEKCTAWQHNLCMGITEIEDQLPEEYYCEQCKPEDHKDLLAAIKRGEQPWARRIEQRKADEKAAKSKKGKKGGRKSARPSAAATSEAASSPKAAPSPEFPTPPAQDAGIKRKHEAIDETKSNGHAQQSPIAQSQQGQSATPATPTVESGPPSEQPAKRAKSVTTDRKSSVASPLPPVESLDQLSEERKKIALALVAELKSLINKSVKDKSYTLPQDCTADTLSHQLGLGIENALNHKHGSGSPQYANQFRTIRFNMKKNRSLVQQILSGGLMPEELAVMTSEQMASDELQKEREKAKEEADKQAMLAHEVGPRYRKTHKGDELIGEEASKPAGGVYKAPVRRGTVDQPHADVPIDTGSPPPGADNSEGYDQPEHEEPKSASKTEFNMQNVWNSVKTDPAKAGMIQRAARKASGSVPKGQDVVMRDAADDTDIDEILKEDDLVSPSSTNPEVLWRGRISMNTIAEFGAVAKWAAGGDVGQRIPYHQLIRNVVEVDGRIDIQRADDYVSGLRYSASTDVCCLELMPLDNPDDRQAYETIYAYFKEKNRWGVFASHAHEAIRDFYLITIEAGGPDKLPNFVRMLDQNQFPQQRQRNTIVLALVVRSKTPQAGAQAGPVQPITQPMTPVNQTQPQFSPVTHGGPFPPPPAGLSTHAIQILGPHIHAPVVTQILSAVTDMSGVQLQNLRDILDQEPATRDQISKLAEHLKSREQAQAVAAGAPAA